MRVPRTLDQLIAAFDALLSVSSAAGDDLLDARRAFITQMSSKRWLRQNTNSDNTSEVLRHEQNVSSSRNGFRHWRRLLDLDKKIIAKSKEDAPSRLFLMLIEMFNGLERERLTLEEYNDTMQLATVKNNISEVFEVNRKDSYYEAAMEVV